MNSRLCESFISRATVRAIFRHCACPPWWWQLEAKLFAGLNNEGRKKENDGVVGRAADDVERAVVATWACNNANKSMYRSRRKERKKKASLETIASPTLFPRVSVERQRAN